ncbi:MAG: tRNA (adenosine(37)-N6)-threonylcarbamoyltransferase complex dimerization subunit type 1 TsaB [Candidatus Bipolaricaulota bacterium]
MTTLGIDTSTRYGTIGLIANGDLKGEFTFNARESQSEKLLATLDTLLHEVEVQLDEISRIAVSIGPGSFTGLRIGISTAQGLAHGLGVTVVGITLTEAYYSRVRGYSGPVCTIISDRRNLVYYALFDEDGEKIRGEESTSIANLEGILEDNTGDRGHPVLLVGDGVAHNSGEFGQFNNSILAEGRLNYPSGAQIGFLGEKIDEGVDQITSIEPLYAQRPIAELNWVKKQKGDNNG